MTHPMKPIVAGTMTDAGKTIAEPEITMDDLEDRLANLFADSEGPLLPGDTGPKPKAALPDGENEKDELKLTEAVTAKKESDVQAKAHRPVPIPLKTGENQKRFYRNKFILSGISAALAAAVLFIVFSLFTRAERDEQQQTVTLRKTDPLPSKIEAKTVRPPSVAMLAEKTEPAVLGDMTPPRQIPEADESGSLLETKNDVLKAPAASYPYSIHAASYRSLQAAELSAETFRNAGLPAFRVRIDLGEKGIWHRVLIGCYKDLVMAQEIIKARQLKGARAVRVNYANFIGAYLTGDDLIEQSRFLSERGYSPYMIQADNGKNYLYTGAFDILAEAERFSVELSAGGIRSLVVER